MSRLTKFMPLFYAELKKHLLQEFAGKSVDVVIDIAKEVEVSVLRQLLDDKKETRGEQE